MQPNLFGEIERPLLTIEQAARSSSVSTATIRNWIRTGYLIQSGRGSITQESHDYFMSAVAGKEKLNARANKLFKERNTAKPLQNFTGESRGIAYENSLSDACRNKEGIYYTPSWIAGDMLQGIEIRPGFKFLDPCCGSGNFIIEAIRAGVSPENVYGFDTDEYAVFMTKERIKEEFGFETQNIRVGDFLKETATLEKRFDLIFTNPPWGKKIERSDKEKAAALYGCGKSSDTACLFMGASFSLLEENGVLGFLMQEAFFNIAAFEGMRVRVAEKKVVRLTDYGKAFKGLVTKAQAIVIENSIPVPETEISCRFGGKTHFRSLDSFKKNPKRIFNFQADENESLVIDRLYSVPHTTLQGKAKWALGIVTGNNKKYCRDTPAEGYVPVYKGTDITKGALKEAATFIPNDFTRFQQVAPIGMYQADEKLIYRFISSDLCFYLDDRQRFILNSANLLIPSGLGITTRQLADLLNSGVMNWLFKKLFATHKVLRSDLESLPIHTGYFSRFRDFSEETYLDYLQITKTGNGTFRLKDENN